LLALGVLLLSILVMPLQNGFSRFLEREADKFSLKHSADPQAFISMMEKLAKQNLADKRPSRVIEFMFYSHPAIASRIELAKRYRDE